MFEINNRNFINFSTANAIIDLYDVKAIDIEDDEKFLTVWFKSGGFKKIFFKDQESAIKGLNEIWELLSNKIEKTKPPESPMGKTTLLDAVPVHDNRGW